jgi:hypothetical protein
MGWAANKQLKIGTTIQILGIHISSAALTGDEGACGKC